MLNTEIFFDRCTFFVNDTGIYIDGVASQGNHWKVNNCRFKEIANTAFTSTEGIGTKIEGCSFENVGNGTNSASIPTSSMISFGDNRNNLVINCLSNRLQNAGIVSDASKYSIAEVYNSSLTKFLDRGYETIYLSDSFRPLAVFSAHNRFTIVNYHLKLGPTNGQYSRVGQLVIGIGDDLAGSEEISQLSFTDQYQFSPTFLTSAGGALLTNFEFRASVADNDTDSGIETIVLFYRNPLSSGATGTISFDISYGV